MAIFKITTHIFFVFWTAVSEGLYFVQHSDFSVTVLLHCLPLTGNSKINAKIHHFFRLQNKMLLF